MDDEAALVERIKQYQAAYDHAVQGASYSIDGRTYTRQDLESLRTALDHARRELKTLRAARAGATLPAAQGVWK